MYIYIYIFFNRGVSEGFIKGILGVDNYSSYVIYLPGSFGFGDDASRGAT